VIIRSEVGLAGSQGVFRFGGFRLDPHRRELTRADEPLSVQPRVFDTLLYLVRHHDRVVTKDELFEKVWEGTVVTEDALTRVVRAIRQALDDDARSPTYVQAVPRVGYRFVAPVETGEPERGGTALRSLAVLPLRPVVATARDESLELGIADTLIARLSLLPDLVVRPLDAVRAYVERSDEAAAVARALGVDACLEATLQQHDDRLRVNARLVAAGDGGALWSESFDERVDDVFVVQDVICDRVVARIAPHLGDGRPLRRQAPRPAPEAYREFLRGRLFAGRHTPADLARAVERYEAALDADPAYAEAWAALGDCHYLLATEGGDVGDHVAAARHAARRALALEPGLPEADCLLAKVAWRYDWDWAGAEERFTRALGRYPNRADLQIAYSDFSCYMGKPERGIVHARRALEIDPVSPWCGALLAQAQYMAGRYDDAIAQAEATRELAPGFLFASLFAGLARFCAGRRDEGIAQLDDAVRSGRQDLAAALALCLGLAGRTDEARGILEAMKAAPGGVPPVALSAAHLACGELETAAGYTRVCVEQKDWHVLLMATDPLFEPFRDHPLFRPYIEALKLPD
jgi:DNA-binding winged helix-turn-helix (wHTH) protein/tetratricopeptide (TPR) repeat protein